MGGKQLHKSLPALKSMYPSPPQTTCMVARDSNSETFSTIGLSCFSVVAADMPPLPMQKEK